MAMFLGIEIGGTKLQLGVGDGQSAAIVELVRHTVDAERGAAGIRAQIESSGQALCQKYRVERVGIGFGGPVNKTLGTTTKSHQIAGWESFPLESWCQERLKLPAVIGNDCDVAALAEARLGAGRGADSVCYVTVGTGIGGGLVLNGQLHGNGRPAAAEIGHLRPGLPADHAGMTVESLASGPAIAAAAKAATTSSSHQTADLLARVNGNRDQITAQVVADAAASGNLLAREILASACQALGWGIAQVITLVAPEVIVVGGGVSLMGEELFFAPLRADVARYVFPPLADSYRIVPAMLGDLVVVHGALALAADAAVRPGG